ncbi:HlyD family secretion protein [Thiopseudomonas alkaliphila]|uniref:HlyD family secretion protein n=1 Tax=Thiopseudomonas alkaliphila TaxID=1697053 RepID=UPI002575A743|nr:efflux RND transporter periplasmic adaptor subunit [Thiopseudomonas alkaliphila]
MNDSQSLTSNAQATAAPAKRRPLLTVLILLILLALLVLGLWLANRPIPAQLEGMVDTDSINISSKVTSRVLALEVKEGQTVQAGQLLVRMSSPEVEAKEQEALAHLASAQAIQQRSHTGAREEDLAALEASWRAAKAQADLAKVSARRAENLYAEGVIAAQRRDEARAARDSASQHEALTKAQYQRALNGEREEDLQVADSQVKIAEAGVFVTRSMQDEIQLTAPINGEIAKRFANVGELVPAGLPIYSLIDLDDLWVTVNLRENQFHSLKMGDELTGSVPALDHQTVTFKVSFINPQANFATWRATRQSSGYDVRSFEVRLTATQQVEGLRPGMSVLFAWPQP